MTPGGPGWLASSFMDMKLEVVPIPVRDIDTAKDFYTRRVGFHLDHDIRPSQTMLVVQLTPPGSACGSRTQHAIAAGRRSPGRARLACSRTAAVPAGDHTPIPPAASRNFAVVPQPAPDIPQL